MDDKCFKYYSEQSKITEPGKFSRLFENLPSSLVDLCKIVHGAITHRDDTRRLYGFEVPNDRKLEPETRYIEKILARIVKLNNSPLTVKRVPEKRFLGSCRDFAILLCAILRHQRIPARLRGGFATYFEPGLYVDHWLCEYWDKDSQGWRLVDAEIGDEEREEYHINFDHTKISGNQFVLAGSVWTLCRSGKTNPNLFGVHSIGIKGLWFIRADILRDLAALNKVELLPWDYTEFGDRQFQNFSELPQKEIELIDRIASLTTADNKVFGEIRSLYENDSRLKIPKTVKSYTTTGLKVVNLL